MQLLTNTNFDFVGKRRFFAAFSVVGAVISFVLLFYPGMNYGIDFEGGTEMQIRFGKSVETDQLRASLTRFGLQKADPVTVDGSNNTRYVVRMESYSTVDAATIGKIKEGIRGKYQSDLTRLDINEESGEKYEAKLRRDATPDEFNSIFTAAGVTNARVECLGSAPSVTCKAELPGLPEKLIEHLRKDLGDPGVISEGVESVSAQIGQQLIQDGFWAVVFSVIGILIYILIRFDMRFAPGAVVATVHDTLMTLGILVISRVEFNMTVLAAMLTIVGYSINDTIVVFDRIRENLQRFGSMGIAEVINRSINETLSRTIMTGCTTLVATFALMFFGGETLFGFGFAMTFGIIVGTYSSIYIASPVIIYLEEQFGEQKSAGVKAGGAQGKAAT
ncbi:MAG: hypothetical protein GMKNLPBB_02372 [Myxococcota bacterium]|nr:hypothetical protein [Myxococcota bacterium]